MSLSTKKKIISAALKLFNQDGMVNVRLQHIADEAFVSIGNMAYHYPNKEAILLKIYEDLTKRQDEVLTEYRVVPLFDNIDRLLHQTFELQQAFVFFYLDTLEILRAYPAIGQTHRQRIQAQIFQLKSIIEFNVSRGALKTELREGVFEKLASQLWMTIDFWREQQAVRTTENLDVEEFKSAIWNLFIPHFTNMGKQEYEQMLQHPYDFFL
ncbi:MAG: TetR/AcrR family transcriptional regulator [Bacteroidota bacterium]